MFNKCCFFKKSTEEKEDQIAAPIPKSEWWKHRPYQEAHADFILMEDIKPEKEIKLVKQEGNHRYQTNLLMYNLAINISHTNRQYYKDMRDLHESKQTDIQLLANLKETQIKNKKLEKELVESIKQKTKEINEKLIDKSRFKMGQSFFVSQDSLPPHIIQLRPQNFSEIELTLTR